MNIFICILMIPIVVVMALFLMTERKLKKEEEETIARIKSGLDDISTTIDKNEAALIDLHNTIKRREENETST